MILLLKTNHQLLMNFWDDLSLEQKQYAIKQYIAIREVEEGRAWDDIMSNPDYPEPINWMGVKNCSFKMDGILKIILN